MNPIPLVLVEDDADDAALVSRHLRSGGQRFDITWVSEPDDYVRALAERPRLILADYNLPRFSARQALEIMQASGQDIPLIVVSGSVGEDRAVELMKAGASDYVMKDRLARLLPAIDRELREVEVRRQNREADLRVRTMAYVDLLTGLPNRNRLIELIEGRLSETAPFRLAVVGLERYDEILRTLGYALVDEMVASVARRLREKAHPNASVARVSDRTFAIVTASELSRDDVSFALEVIQAVDHTMELAALRLDIRARVGVVEAPHDAQTPESLLRRAEIALDRAARIDSAWSRYSPARDGWSPARLVLVNDMRNAAANHQFHLDYQPRVRLSDGRLAGVEALIRWTHPTFGLVSPDEFIPLAESTGHIHAITEWVLAEAAMQAGRWRAEGRCIPVGVNISTRTLTDSDLPGCLRRLLSQHDLPAGALELELTESVLMAEPARARSVLEELRAMGVKVYLDDFGTGFSSLGYLRTLPIHALKIDKSFVIGGLEDPGAMTIVRSTIQLAHNLGLQVVAEGVETAQALAQLTSLCCDEAQGFFIQPPSQPAQISRWLEATPEA